VRAVLIVQVPKMARKNGGHANLFPEVALAFEIIWEKELIYGNFQQGDKLVKYIEAWFLPSVFDSPDPQGISAKNNNQK